MLYLFDKSEKLIRLIDRGAALEATMTEQVGMPTQLNSVLVGSADISHAFYIGHKDPVNNEYFKYYKIISTKWVPKGIGIYGIETAHDDLSADGYIKDLRPQNRAIALVFADILSGSRWAVGNVNVTVSVTTNFYYLSRLEALQKLMELTGCEFSPRIVFDGHSIVGRYIDVSVQAGEDRGRRFVHGSNLLEVVKEDSNLDLYTALIGFGKGEAAIDEQGVPTGGFGRKLTFTDVSWSVANGDPVNKPLHQEYVEIPSLTAAFGYPDGKPRIGKVDFPEIEDPEILLQNTYDYLLATGRPKVYYRASVLDVGDTGLGDTVTIIRDDYNIRYKVRIVKRAVNLLQPSLVQVEFGDAPVNLAVSQLMSLRKLIDYQASEYHSGYDQLIEYMASQYWGEDGYNYDLKIGNEYGLPAGLYSFDKPIDENPTKWIYFGAGKIVISNEKNPNGTWKLKTIMDGDGLATGIVATKHVSSEGIDASVIKLSDSTTAQEAFDAAVTVFRDIPQPPYKQGDLWHMPELTVDYWSNKGLTLGQMSSMVLTVVDCTGGNSYVCVNGRASGSFNRADWELTGTTDKTSEGLSQRITTNTNTITSMGMEIEQITETVDAQGSEITSNTNSITAMGTQITSISGTVDAHGTAIGTAQSDIATLQATNLTFETTLQTGGTNLMKNSTFGGIYAPDITGWSGANSIGAFLDRWGYLTVASFLAIWGSSTVKKFLTAVDKK